MLSVAVLHAGKVIAFYGDVSLERDIIKLAPQSSKTEQKITNSFVFSYLCTQSVIFACVTPHSAEQSAALPFLDDISRRFSSVFGSRVYSAPNHSLDAEFARLFGNMITSYGGSESKTQQIKNRLAETEKVLTSSVAMAEERGDSLSLIQGKAEELNAVSEEFLNQSKNLKNKMRCSWIKSNIAKVCIIIAAIYLLLAFFCGGLNLAPRCISKDQ